MKIKFPENNDRFHWTSHIKSKMVFYRISEQKIKSILKSPDRREEGIAPNTVAVMKKNNTPKRKEEIWVMYLSRLGRDRGLTRTERGATRKKISKPSKVIMISAWRYPGVTKPGERVPVPDDIAEELGIENS